MSCHNDPSQGWNSHHLRQIRDAARFISSVLHDPIDAMNLESNVQPFLDDVKLLRQRLPLTEQWSRDETTRPPGISSAIADALHSLWGIFSRLNFPMEHTVSNHGQFL